MEITKKLKEFSLSSFAVDNGTSIFLVTIMILLFGIQGYNRMPKEQYPEAYLPKVFINTPYFGNSASEIENLVSRPIEKELNGIAGLKDVNSTSIQDFSVIIAEFDESLTLEDALRKVKDAVDIAKAELPSDLDKDPIIQEVLFSEFPIMTVNVAGSYPMDDLRKYAEYLQDKIEDLQEISRVDLKGAQDREVKIEVDVLRMQASQISFRDIEMAISQENMTMSAGELINNDFRRSVRVIGQFTDVKEIENIIVKSENERPVYLKNFATVQYGFEERTSYSRADQLPVISLDVVKGSGQNLLNASDKIKVVIDDAKKILPEDIEISIFNDQSINTRLQVSNLENSIISGVILVILVLLFFLGLRNASFVGLAIPLSMLLGILWLYLTSVTMNIVVLFSLILALGLLVDNAIVVVENIYRYMQNGYNRKDAAKYGAGEVAQPIIVSTLTTLAAFVPLAFWPGIMGKFMRYMPITLIIVLSSSLFVALVINPVFTSRFMKVDEAAEEKSEHSRRRKNVLLGVLVMLAIAVIAHLFSVLWIRNLMAFALIISLVNFFILKRGAHFFQNRLLPKLERAYNRFIYVALRKVNPILIFLSTFVLLFISIGLLFAKSPPVEYFPTSDPMYVNVFVETPLGSDIEATNNLAKKYELKLESTLEPYEHIIEDILVQIGEETSDPNSPPEPGLTPNKARITVSFVPAEERGGISTVQVMEEIRETVQGEPGVQIVVDSNNTGPPTGYPVNIEIKGDDIDSLSIYTENIRSYLKEMRVPGIEELKMDTEIGKPELLVNINRESARRYGISTAQIASTIRTAVFGSEISKFKIGEDEYPIRIRADVKYRNDIDVLMNQKITFRDQARRGAVVQIPISAVADYEYASTYNSIKRKNQKRVVTLYSNVLPGYNTNQIVTELKDGMKLYDLPDGYTYEFTGEAQQQAEDMSFLLTTFLVAIFAIFIIIVAQFNSVISPFIIILSVLFSTIGVFLGYVITGKTISVVFTGVGIISLAGVVVNNAIVLIDYINLLIKRKRRELDISSMNDLDSSIIKEAIIQGGATRLRPVLLTAITTILGLIPLAIGFNFNFFTLISELDPKIFIGGDNSAMWGPMAWTIIYGLVFATFLTLVVVPVMYWLAYKMKSFSTRLFTRKKVAIE